MVTVKQTPEDFKVTELPCFEEGELTSGTYTYCVMQKRNIGTLEAVARIASRLKIPPKTIGFAGNKDKKAVTIQYISIKGSVKEFHMDEIAVRPIGRSDTPIHLGYLQGNAFEILVRDVTAEQIEKAKARVGDPFVIPNLFGQQRFSSNNALVGKAIIQGQFNQALTLVLEQRSSVSEAVTAHLADAANDYVGALRRIPMKLLKLYVHAYQSWLFNTLLQEFVSKKQQMKLPLIGFGTELEEFPELKESVVHLMKKEKITFRDFIIRQIPEVSSEGTSRSAFVEVSDFVMNEGDAGVGLSFSLPKNSYATIVIEYLFG